MVYKFVVFAAVLTVARAGVIGAPAYGLSAYASPALKVAAPAASSYSSISQHNAVSHGYAGPALAYSHAAPALAYSHSAPALAYAAPVAKYAAPVAYAAPVTKALVVEPSAPAHYDFAYSVQDPHTGDVKEQQESRQGDAVHGRYSLVEADGSRRIVEYTADDHNGFNAVVHREPAQHPVAVKAVAPVALKAIHANPALSYAAPAVGYAHAAPAYYHH